MTDRERVARAIVARFPPRLHPDNDDFADALKYADAALSVVGPRIAELKDFLADHKCYRCGEAIQENHWLRAALRAIDGPCDEGPFIWAYREAGGCYEGLQAIARLGLDPTGRTDA